MATDRPFCESRRAVFCFRRANFETDRLPSFAAAKIRCGNRPLTMISVWLAGERRADSPRFDMLAGDASLGFGRASHATEQDFSVGAYRRARLVAVETAAAGSRR